MSKLFILGNGFDVAHGLKTRYSDFRRWLIKRYELTERDTESEKLKETLIEKYNLQDVAERGEQFLVKLLDNEDSAASFKSMKAEEGQAFVNGFSQEWLDISEGRIKVSMEHGIVNGLKAANCMNLAKVYEKIGDNEVNQESMDKAIMDICYEEFDLGAAIEFQSSFGVPDDVIEPKDIAKLIIASVDNATTKNERGEFEWNEFENALGELDFDLLTGQKEVDETDMGPKMMQILFHGIYIKILPQVVDFFKEWLKSIDINSAKKRQLLDNIAIGENLFLTFNYTDTLKIYGIQDACHIHGKLTDKIILGHGNDAVFSGSDDAMKGSFKKNTSLQISLFKRFFASLRNVTEIYSIGFSFSSVDLPYIREIFKNIDSENVTWYLTKFDENKESGEIKGKTNNEVFRERINEIAKSQGKACPTYKIFEI